MYSALYEGTVSHVRLTPFRRSFRSRLVMVFLDLGELDRVFAGRWFWGIERPAFLGFRRADHFGDPEEPLERSVRELVERRTGERLAGPVRVLTQLRSLGYAFNPLTLYYCYEPNGTDLQAVVAEVSNTPWGERHCYVLEARNAERRGNRLAFRTPKELHVSPFLGMDVEHRWRLGVPDRRLTLTITDENIEGPQFIAALRLDRRAIDGAALARALLARPLPGIQTIAGIYLHALRLWLRGAPYFPHPRKPAAEPRVRTS